MKSTNIKPTPLMIAIRHHYNLNRYPCQAEVNAEIAMIERRSATHMLDDRQGLLAARLALASEKMAAR